MNMDDNMSNENIEPMQRLSRDLAKAAATMSIPQARFLVGGYYKLQDTRKRASNQVWSLTDLQEKQGKDKQPHEILQWFEKESVKLEAQIKRALQVFAESKREGRWALSVVGIGPVITAGLIAYTKIEWDHINKETEEVTHKIANSAGSFWRLAGLDPTVEWKTGEKIPWNASFKTLCWKIGQSFLKQSSREGCVYGKLLLQRKEYEVGRNERGELSAQAVEKLAKFKINPKTEAFPWYSGCYPAEALRTCLSLEELPDRKKYLNSVKRKPGEGLQMLPPAHLLQRSCRYATKIFLSHFHHVAFECAKGVAPPMPFAIDVLNHKDYTAPPGWPCE